MTVELPGVDAGARGGAAPRPASRSCAMRCSGSGGCATLGLGAIVLLALVFGERSDRDALVPLASSWRWPTCCASCAHGASASSARRAVHAQPGSRAARHGRRRWRSPRSSGSRAARPSPRASCSARCSSCSSRVFYFGRGARHLRGGASRRSPTSSFALVLPAQAGRPGAAWCATSRSPSALFALVSAVLISAYRQLPRAHEPAAAVLQARRGRRHRTPCSSSASTSGPTISRCSRAASTRCARGSAEQIGTDPLTGCLNRRALETRLRTELRQAKRRGTTLAVAGDRSRPLQGRSTTRTAIRSATSCCSELAGIMKATARDTDAVARLGGDEFVVVLPDTGWQGALTFAERHAPPRGRVHVRSAATRRCASRSRSASRWRAAPIRCRRRCCSRKPTSRSTRRRARDATVSSLDASHPRMTELITLADLEAAARAHRAGGGAHAAAPVRRAVRAARCARSGSSRRCCSAAARSSSAARTTSSRSSLRRRARARRRRAVVGQSCAGGRAGGEAVRRAGGGRDADDGHAGEARRRRAARRAHRARGHDDARSMEARRRAGATRRAHDGAAVRPSVDHRGAGHGRARDRRRPARRRHGARSRRRRRVERRRRRRRSSCALPNARVVGVEPAGAPKLTRARAAGRPVRLEHDGGSPTDCSPSRSATLHVRASRSVRRRRRDGRRRRAARRDAAAVRPA